MVTAIVTNLQNGAMEKTVRKSLIAGFTLAAGMALSPYAISAAAGRAIGDKGTDGTVYAGISPDTGSPLYTTVADAPDHYSWFKGTEYCAALEADGHRDWRVPTIGELAVLYANRNTGALTGSFNETGEYPTGRYWSSSLIRNRPLRDGDAWTRRFSDGRRIDGYRYDFSSLRCVR